MKKLEEYVRTIPDFPEEGIMFRDVTSVLQDADGLQLAIDTMEEMVSDLTYDVVAGAESRGFIFGVPIAYNLRKPFIPVRRKGKLPCETISVSYDLEYGSAEVEMHKDAILPGQKVVLVDDLIATGGTIEAITKLIEERKEARKAKNFALADEIRDKIAEMGYVITETREGTKVTKK